MDGGSKKIFLCKYKFEKRSKWIVEYLVFSNNTGIKGFFSYVIFLRFIPLNQTNK
jgi:hypothetical protein